MELLSYITENALVLIPALVILGQIAKSVAVFPDRFIPLALLPFGVIGACLLNGWVIDAIVQGVLVTGAAVYGDQLVKQLFEK